MSLRIPARASAANAAVLIAQYLRLACVAAGMEWGTRNDAEMRDLAESMVGMVAAEAVARFEVSAEDASVAAVSRAARDAIDACLAGDPDDAHTTVRNLPIGDRMKIRRAAKLLADALSNLNRCPADDLYVAADEPDGTSVKLSEDLWQRWHVCCLADRGDPGSEGGEKR